jgi:hypothetical protein
MSIEFMILGAPRSATTWASNWLTTDTTLCLHDPLVHWQKEELDDIRTLRRLGVACTGLALFPEWVNAHPARKIILHRPLSEVDESLVRMGLTPCSTQWEGVLDRIEGVHLDWKDMFTRPQFIYEYLLDLPFDAERWSVLRQMNVQPNLDSIQVNKAAVARFVAELRVH